MKLEKLESVLSEIGPTLAYRDVNLPFQLRRWEVEKPHGDEEMEEEEEVDDEATISD